jgi:Fe-S-cluster containining protein
MSRIKGEREIKIWPCQHCGWCCEDFPMHSEFVDKHRDQFQRPVIEEVQFTIDGERKTRVITGTRDCVFLKLDHLCAEKSWVEKFITEVNQHARTGTH